MSIRLVESDASSSQMVAEKRERLRANLELRLRNLFVAKNEGCAYQKIVQLQGLVDGYSQSLRDVGAFTDAELLQIVVYVRRGVNGPPTNMSESDSLAPTSVALPGLAKRRVVESRRKATG